VSPAARRPKPPAPADRIHVRDLAARCIVGIYPEERRAKQDIVLNLTLEGDFRRAAASDDIADAVDYKRLKKQVIAHVEGSRYQLIETLAQAVADICLSDPGVRRVTVTVDKPGALRFARSVAVEITRGK
jgi:D-erythro-7,8-dihydroneopterin triphosphate epimerase